MDIVNLPIREYRVAIRNTPKHNDFTNTEVRVNVIDGSMSVTVLVNKSYGNQNLPCIHLHQPEDAPTLAVIGKAKILVLVSNVVNHLQAKQWGMLKNGAVVVLAGDYNPYVLV